MRDATSTLPRHPLHVCALAAALLVPVLLGACAQAPTARNPAVQSTALADPQLPYKIRDALKLDQPLFILAAPKVPYPKHLQDARIGGQVMVAFEVEPDGSVAHPRVIDSTHPDLGELALQTVAGYRFSPPMRQGQAVRIRLRQPFHFQP